jgi:hypothetical protein
VWKEKRNAYKILVEKYRRKRSHGKLRHRLKDNTNMDHKETGLEGTDWINLAQDMGKWWAVL